MTHTQLFKFTIITICCILLNIVSTSADDTISDDVLERKIVRVGYILDNGYYVMEENGGLSGYNYDYLMMVSSHTKWEYEFVLIDEENTESSKQKAKQMLINGEIDLLGSMFKDEETEDLFEFPNLETGISRDTLVSLANNYKITQDNYFLQDGLKIALVEGEYVNEELLQLNQVIHINNEIVYVDDSATALELLVSEEVDAIISTDTSEQSSMLTYLTTVHREPFYFVTQKGNTDLMEQLDFATKRINVIEPNLHQRLLDEYFSNLHQGPIILTKEEEQALADYDYLTVALIRGSQPYQFFEEGDNVTRGISVEILEEISNIIGVEFKYVWCETREEIKEKVANQEVDIISTLPFDSRYELTSFYDVMATRPYLSNPVTWIHNTDEVDNAKPLYYYIYENIPFFPDDELTEISNLESALTDLSKYGNTSILTDPYMAHYYIQKLGLNNVELQKVNAVNSKFCLGIGMHLDPAIVGLLNHSLLHLDPYLVDEIIYNNTTTNTSMTIDSFWRQYSSAITTLIFLSLIAMVTFLYNNGKKLKELSQQDSLTKLYNAGYFHEYTEEKAKTLKKGCLILIDIDLFKQINDNHGHQQGDSIIISVADNLKQYFRSDDVIARLGGDEFIILLENNLNKEELERRCQNILDSLSCTSNDVPTTLSIGGYIFNQPTDYKDLYQLADKVLYKVKKKGRNGYLFESQE